MKTSELTGMQLDYWVAKAEGHALTSEWDQDGYVLIGAGSDEDLQRPFRPSTDWAHGGPIIERESLLVAPNGGPGSGWHSRVKSAGGFLSDESQGPTPLVAAMRAYVAAKFGEEVPDATA